ncbi:MAG TPA: alpha/beta hydrolase [Sphingobium sp.]|uniref:alpha/beta hydrolase n=1 Tax=Sphingobium sp. TaxID=1912891 RepID=UPI002ED1490D
MASDQNQPPLPTFGCSREISRATAKGSSHAQASGLSIGIRIADAREIIATAEPVRVILANVINAFSFGRGQNVMTDTSDPALLHVPARSIALPSHLSPEARAQALQPMLSNPPWPEPGDMDGWRALIARMDAMGEAGLTMMSQHLPGTVEERDVDGVRVFVATPAGVSDDDPSVYLDIHGGALLWGGGESCRALAKVMAAMFGARTWSVDYRMPPDHPFPAGVDDCVTVYRALLKQTDARHIIIGGPSAGGNIAAAAILKARDEGLPLPAAAVLMTPEIDLTESGDSFRTLLGIDTALTSSLMPANLLYAGGHDLTDPYVSPLFGDFTKGFPPTLLQSGTRDLFLSNTVLMHRALRRADVEAELHIFDAATHVMFMGGPESEDRTREIRRFADRHWGRRT